MQFEESFIKGVFKITPRKFEDERGFFFESFNQKEFDQYVPGIDFVQDNHSFSHKNVLRGLHFQKMPYSQGKLVRVIKGKVLDIVVDINPDSPTYGQYDSFVLDDDTFEMVWLPNTMAHGFLVLEEAIFVYKCSASYHVESESGIVWNDPTLNIDWGIDNPIISGKDAILPTFENIQFLSK